MVLLLSDSLYSCLSATQASTVRAMILYMLLMFNLDYEQLDSAYEHHAITCTISGRITQTLRVGHNLCHHLVSKSENVKIKSAFVIKDKTSNLWPKLRHLLHTH